MFLKNGNQLSVSQQVQLLEPFTRKEVKEAVWSIKVQKVLDLTVIVVVSYRCLGNSRGGCYKCCHGVYENRVAIRTD